MNFIFRLFSAQFFFHSNAVLIFKEEQQKLKTLVREYLIKNPFFLCVCAKRKVIISYFVEWKYHNKILLNIKNIEEKSYSSLCAGAEKKA